MKPEPIAPRPISPSPPQRACEISAFGSGTESRRQDRNAASYHGERAAKEAAPVAAPSEEVSIGSVRDLPQNIQAELPAIVVNGYIYAKTPSDRSVLMNQKLLHEGDQVAPGLVLEKMLPKGAILSYKGYRYRVAF